MAKVNQSKHPEQAELIWAKTQWLLDGQKILHQWHAATLVGKEESDD